MIPPHFHAHGIQNQERIFVLQRPVRLRMHLRVEGLHQLKDRGFGEPLAA